MCNVVWLLYSFFVSDRKKVPWKRKEKKRTISHCLLASTSPVPNRSPARRTTLWVIRIKMKLVTKFKKVWKPKSTRKWNILCWTLHTENNWTIHLASAYVLFATVTGNGSKRVPFRGVAVRFLCRWRFFIPFMLTLLILFVVRSPPGGFNRGRRWSPLVGEYEG